MSRANSRALSGWYIVLTILSGLLIANSICLLAMDDPQQGEDISSAYHWVFLAHLTLGLLLLCSFLVYVVGHVRRVIGSSKRAAKRAGGSLAMAAAAVILSGLLLTRGIPGFELQSSFWREVYRWIHIGVPLLCAVLLLLHRRLVNGVNWRAALATVSGCVAATVIFLGLLPDSDAQLQQGPKAAAFTPSLASTSHGRMIDPGDLMMDDYCADCHADAHAGWAASAHRFSSFNNPVYKFSFDNARRHLEARDGSAEALNFCAGCHDPVLMFSGRLLTAKGSDPEANAGITCIACHAIDAIESPKGNADYALGVPSHYPFARSENQFLLAINHLLIRANPAQHKRSFLKPLHQSAEFCGSCHKVHIPEEFNAYKWLRGQNHYDSFLLSGVSGVGVSSFYYPATAKSYCGDCHMKTVPSDDIAADLDEQDGLFKVHSHVFPGGHSALGSFVGLGEHRLQEVKDILQGSVRVDLMGLREGTRPDARFIGPLGVSTVNVRAGETYLLEVVLRVLNVGHLFTEGTADSNEIWLEILLRDEERIVARSGGIDAGGVVDPEAHFVNSYVVDRNGEKITRRNVEDIFTAVYNHQIGPGSADTVHYELEIPAASRGMLTLEAKLHYRKFTADMLSAMADQGFDTVDLPVVTIDTAQAVLNTESEDQAALDTGGLAGVPLWERWNDYGIGLLRKPGLGQLRQAEEAFKQVEAAGSAAGTLNLARTYLRGGQLDSAAEVLARATTDERVATAWTRAWLQSELELSEGRLDPAIALLKQLLDNDFPGVEERGFDFSRDYRVWARLANAYWLRARRERGASHSSARRDYLELARDAYKRVLAMDPEHLDAHWGLTQVYSGLGEPDRAQRHRQLHERYRPDDTAAARAISRARALDPVLLRTTNDLVVYPLSACGSEENRCE